MSDASTPGSAVAVIFDGDDTLWSTEELYDEARQQAAHVVRRSGLDAERWERLERALAVDNVAVHGYSPDRFPTSCVQAYERVCADAGRPVDPAVMHAVYDAARSVFQRTPRRKPGVPQVLERLRSRGVRLALLTKGDPDVQRRRIDASGLVSLFEAVEIVAEKTPQVMLALAARLGAQPSSTWMVGNSVRSDMLPAVQAGLRAAWIDSHVWEHERTHDHLIDDRVLPVLHLEALMDVIAA